MTRQPLSARPAAVYRHRGTVGASVACAVRPRSRARGGSPRLHDRRPVRPEPKLANGPWLVSKERVPPLRAVLVLLSTLLPVPADVRRGLRPASVAGCGRRLTDAPCALRLRAALAGAHDGVAGPVPVLSCRSFPRAAQHPRQWHHRRPAPGTGTREVRAPHGAAWGFVGRGPDAAGRQAAMQLRPRVYQATSCTTSDRGFPSPSCARCLPGSTDVPQARAARGRSRIRDATHFQSAGRASTRTH